MAGDLGLLYPPGPGRGAMHGGHLLSGIIARLRWRSLDRSLAEGSDPTASPLLARRAAQLTSARRRRALARSLAGALRAAQSPPAMPSVRVVPDRREVVLARPNLERLEALLLAATPVYAEGVARLELMVTDGAGPLFAPAYPGQLRDHLEDLGLALEGREERW